MINWKSILSSYDDKPTLLQWLKMVKKALDESVLESVSVEQPTETTAVLSFNFTDGTSIKAPAITLPRGVQGAKGDKGTEIVSMTVYHTEVVGDKTNTQINVQYSDHPSDTFTVSAQNGKDGAKGADGANGVSITGIDTVSDEVVGDETLTTVRAHYSNNTNDEFVVTAKNGKDATKYYMHVIYADDVDNATTSYNLCVISAKKESFTPEYLYAHGNIVAGSVVTKCDAGTPLFFGIASQIDNTNNTFAITCFGAGVFAYTKNMSDTVTEL